MKRVGIILILLLSIILPIEVKALEVDKNNITIEKGKSDIINLTTTIEQEVSEIEFTLVYSANDIPAYYTIASGLTDDTPRSSSHKIKLSEPKTGTIPLGTINISVKNESDDTSGTINVYKAKAITSSGETINLNSQLINVTIENTQEIEEDDEEISNENTLENKPKEEKKKEEEKNTEINEVKLMLEKIESNIVKIELQDGIYEYEVNVKEEVEELDLNPIARDKKYKIEISSQKISELIDNQIIITVKDGEKKKNIK